MHMAIEAERETEMQIVCMCWDKLICSHLPEVNREQVDQEYQ